MFEWARGVSGWIAIAHKSRGRWDWFRQLQWADAWTRHCLATGNIRLIKMVWDLPVYRMGDEGAARNKKRSQSDTKRP